jgi:hypothetical protein
MDINLTGVLAANVSLIQPSKDSLSIITQSVATVLTVLATLGGVWLAHHLASKSEAIKRAGRRKRKKYGEAKKSVPGIFDCFLGDPGYPRLD